MTMTPEETARQEIWWVLRRIKEEILTTPKDKPVVYKLTNLIAPGVPPKRRERNIIYKLKEWKAVKIKVDHPLFFELEIIQPKFNEIYEKFQPKGATKLNGNFKAEIDKWLSKKTPWAIQKIWQVIVALNSERQLRDKNIFKIPHDKFKSARITNQRNLEAILTSLHEKKFIEVSKKLGETPPSDDPNKPSFSVWATIIDKPEIIKNEDTEIKIFPQKFEYLKNKLKALVHPEEISKKAPKQPAKEGRPYCVTKGVWGYLKFGKYGKKVKIGRTNSRHFRLLQCLLAPSIGVTKTVDSVFEAIRLPKDRNDPRLSGFATAETRKVEIIQFAIKELQKGNKLRGKIKFEFDANKRHIKAKFLG